MINKISDIEAAQIAELAYKRDQPNILIDNVDGSKTFWNVIEIIEDKDTGLNGYVLRNPETGQIVISFEGTQLDDGFAQGARDILEDGRGIVLGDSDYPNKESKPRDYLGTEYQDSMLEVGRAKIEDGKFVMINKNQFTEADPIVKKYIEKYGPENITFIGHSLGGALAEYFAVKYDSNAITFAAAGIYNLLDDEQKEKVKNGEYRGSIISYTYPNDIIVNMYKHPIGSTYYMSNPVEDNRMRFDTHGLENYTDKTKYDEDGYFIPELLYNDGMFGQPFDSPLKLKNSGLENFHIVIKTEILDNYVTEMENSATLIENSRKSFGNFYDFYTSYMSDLKNKYASQVGYGKYDLLTQDDVEEIYHSLGNIEDGVPFIFSLDRYDHILALYYKAINDTEEIAFHLNEMSKNFEETDRILAEWLGLKN